MSSHGGSATGQPGYLGRLAQCSRLYLRCPTQSNDFVLVHDVVVSINAAPLGFIETITERATTTRLVLGGPQPCAFNLVPQPDSCVRQQGRVG